MQPRVHIIEHTNYSAEFFLARFRGLVAIEALPYAASQLQLAQTVTTASTPVTVSGNPRSAYRGISETACRCRCTELRKGRFFASCQL